MSVPAAAFSVFLLLTGRFGRLPGHVQGLSPDTAEKDGAAWPAATVD